MYSISVAKMLKGRAALPAAERFFEEAMQYDPNDLNVLTAMKQIYARKKSPKYDEIVKKIKEIEK